MINASLFFQQEEVIRTPSSTLNKLSCRRLLVIDLTHILIKVVFQSRVELNFVLKS